MALLDFRSPLPKEVDLKLTSELQHIAFDAWNNALDRDEAEIKYKFDFLDEAHLSRTQKIYRSFAKVGGLKTVKRIDGDMTRIAGFSLARHDVSGNVLARTYKRLLDQDRVYAWISHICVDPSFQRQGIGSKLLAQTLQPFKPERVPTAYVFQENQVALLAFAAWGFNFSPPLTGFNAQVPTPKEDYFGPGTVAPNQYRLAAISVADVLDRLPPNK